MERPSQSGPLDDLGIGALLKSISDDMLEGLQVIALDWRYLYVNETVARHGRRSKEDLLSRTMMECYPGIEKTGLFRQMERCMEGRESIRMENRFEFPDGGFGWFELFMHPVEEGMAVLSFDITERKLAEEALREKIEELEVVMHLTVERELRMTELKKVIEELKKTAPKKGGRISSMGASDIAFGPSE